MTDFPGFLCRRATAPASSSGGVVITLENGSYAVKFPYDSGVIQQMKTIRPALKQWDAEQKRWLIHPDAIATVAGFLQQRFGPVTIPEFQAVAPQLVKRLVKLEYLGACKSRGNEEPEAMGYSEGQWRVVIPQSVLENYFGNSTPKSGRQTLYQVLCVVESATAQEIKSAHRKLARQWHPDVNQEDEARERFEAIQAAYELLSNPILRKKYDVGLYFERQGQGEQTASRFSGYVPPLRCGMLKVEGVIELGRLRVAQIVAWDEITDERGRVLVTSWPAGAKEFQAIWLDNDSIAATTPF